VGWQILPPNGTQEASDHNWRNLQQATGFASWAPVPSSTALIGFAPSITGTGLLVQGFYGVTIPNLVFFNISMSATTGNVSLSWTGGKFLLLPKLYNLLGSGTVNYPFSSFPVVNGSTGAYSGNVTMELIDASGALITTSSTIGRNAVLINNTGATITVTAPTLSIQGFYFSGK
jgi:hypothetical protein